MSHDQPFKALHDYRREFYGSVVIEAGYLSVLGKRDYGSLLETCWYYRLYYRRFYRLSNRESLKMSLKTVASFSGHACSTRPVYPSSPAAL